MTLSQLLPEIRKLNLLDKIRLISFLAEEIEKPIMEDQYIFDPKKTYYLATPYRTYGAAEILMKALQESDEN